MNETQDRDGWPIQVGSRIRKPGTDEHPGWTAYVDAIYDHPQHGPVLRCRQLLTMHWRDIPASQAKLCPRDARPAIVVKHELMLARLRGGRTGALESELARCIKRRVTNSSAEDTNQEEEDN